jgi:hypothetical protein
MGHGLSLDSTTCPFTWPRAGVPTGGQFAFQSEYHSSVIESHVLADCSYNLGEEKKKLCAALTLSVLLPDFSTSQGSKEQPEEKVCSFHSVEETCTVVLLQP